MLLEVTLCVAEVSFFGAFYRMLYLLLAIFLGVVISVVAGVFLFPRSISIKLEKAVPLNISMSLSNTTKPFIVINVSLLKATAELVSEHDTEIIEIVGVPS